MYSTFYLISAKNIIHIVILFYIRNKIETVSFIIYDEISKKKCTAICTIPKEKKIKNKYP